MKLYLDTSVPSMYYDDRYPDRSLLTRKFWEKLKDHEVIISIFVEAELTELRLIDPGRADKTLALIDPFPKAGYTSQVDSLVQTYMNAGIFRRSARTDARHIAVATLEKVDYLVSWNFKDIVNLKTKAQICAVNISLGYSRLEIISPPELP